MGLATVYGDNKSVLSCLVNAKDYPRIDFFLGNRVGTDLNETDFMSCEIAGVGIFHGPKILLPLESWRHITDLNPPLDAALIFVN